jgi:hypothetical protein
MQKEKKKEHATIVPRKCHRRQFLPGMMASIHDKIRTSHEGASIAE